MGEMLALQKSGYIMFVVLSVKSMAELVLGSIWDNCVLALMSIPAMSLAIMALILSKQYGYELDELDLLDDEDLEDEEE